MEMKSDYLRRGNVKGSAAAGSSVLASGGTIFTIRSMNNGSGTAIHSEVARKGIGNQETVSLAVPSDILIFRIHHKLSFHLHEALCPHEVFNITQLRHVLPDEWL